MNPHALRGRQRSTFIARTLLAAAATAALLGGCSTPQVQDYAKEAPVLELRDYFNGTLDAYGIFTDRSGKVLKRFTTLPERLVKMP